MRAYIFSITLLLFATASPSWATTIQNNGGFFRLNKLRTAPKNAQKALSAVARIGGHDFQCGAVILSKEGHVATAMHCLKNCLFNPKTKEPKLKMNQQKKGSYYSSYEIKAGEQIHCSIDFKRDNLAIFPASEFVNQQYSLGDPKVLWAGKGEHWHNEPLVADLTQKEFDSFKELTEDIAILKYEDVQFYNEETTQTPCIQVEEARMDPGDPVWNIGYPHANDRLHYRGWGSVYSMGFIRADIKEDPIYKKYASQMSKEKREIFWEREMEIWNQEHILLHTTDAFRGNSGGATVSENGQLLGIVFGITKSSKTVYQEATTLSYDARALKRRVRDDLGQKAADEIFNCKEF